MDNHEETTPTKKPKEEEKSDTSPIQKSNDSGLAEIIQAISIDETSSPSVGSKSHQEQMRDMQMMIESSLGPDREVGTMNLEKQASILTAWKPDKFDIKKRPLFIGVTGGTAGGKTSICDM